MNNKNQALKKLLQFTVVITMFLVVFILFYSCSNSKSGVSFDFDNVNLVQLQEPNEGDEIAVFELCYEDYDENGDPTEIELGAYKMVLYRSYAPKTVENFVNRVNNGEYDGMYIYAIQEDVYFLGGGDVGGGYDYEKSKKDLWENETTPDLWPFRGAVASISPKDGYSGFRFIGINSVEFTDEFIAELRAIEGSNPDIIEAFIELGGVPNFSQQYTIFGQIYEGLDILDEITSQPVLDESSLRPVTNIKIKKATISTYEKSADSGANADE